MPETINYVSIQLGGATEAFFGLSASRLAFSSGDTILLAPLLLCHRHLDSGTDTVGLHATVKTACQSSQALELQRCTRLPSSAARCMAEAQEATPGAWCCSSCAACHCKRASASSMRYPSRLSDGSASDSARAACIGSLFLVDGKKKSCICTCVPDVLCQEL